MSLLTPRLADFAEALLVRAVPGVINLGTLLLMGQWLGVADYGVYSTAILSSGLLANLLFGPLTFSILPQHAEHAARGTAVEYEAASIALVLAIALVVGALAGLLSKSGILDWTWLAPAATFGMFQAFQELQRARLQFRAYGVAAASQSLLFLACTAIVVRANPSASSGLVSFSFSYAIGSVICLALLHPYPLVRPAFHHLRRTLLLGTHYTASKLPESGLTLGLRLLLVAVGTPQQLGVFSFSVDLAQRTAGVILNLFRFAVLPRAFRAGGNGNDEAFRHQLFSGILLSALACVGSCLVLLALRWSHWIPSLNTELFQPWSFLVVAAAVILNQLKKSTVDPFALRSEKAEIITLGYAGALVTALPVAGVLLLTRIPLAAETAYLAAGAVCTALSSHLLRTCRTGSVPSGR